MFTEIGTNISNAKRVHLFKIKSRPIIISESPTKPIIYPFPVDSLADEAWSEKRKVLNKCSASGYPVKSKSGINQKNLFKPKASNISPKPLRSAI